MLNEGRKLDFPVFWLARMADARNDARPAGRSEKLARMGKFTVADESTMRIGDQLAKALIAAHANRLAGLEMPASAQIRGRGKAG